MTFSFTVPWLESCLALCDRVVVKAANKLPDNHALVVVLMRMPDVGHFKEERRWRAAQGDLFEM
jgi:hypothetical protein